MGVGMHLDLIAAVAAVALYSCTVPSKEVKENILSDEPLLVDLSYFFL
jgi:hypothetical protein